MVVDTPIARDGVIRGDFVGNDGYSAMREMVRGLVACGHRRIGSIRVFAGVYSSDQRFRGVVDQLSADGLPLVPELHRVIENVPLHQQGRSRIRELMELPERPTAVICTHDAIALNVFDELRKMGRGISEDVWLSGFDDQFFAEALHFSSVRQPLRQIGRRAVEILLEKQPVRRQEFLPCELKIR
ncbi:HTH-type transcriptional repressor CytR [bioreactor metagenome]|uniref:HTH-type transcriptional repressor CytR n=1 Tax=bioreactor metagenome TaxID=1076179 RepID=A0A645EXT2_9ZZZZ